MSYRGRRQKNRARDEDIENQVHNNDGVDSGEKKTRKKTLLDPQGLPLRSWSMLFVVSCVIAVSVDPLFFYLPVVNETKKCVTLDRRLKITAICLRSVTDLIYLANMILQFLCPYIDEGARKLGRFVVVTDSRSIAKRYMLSWYFLIDILAVLPLPQVLVPIMFSAMRGSNYLDTRKVLRVIVLLQYVPRVIRIYLSWRKLISTVDKLARIVWIKATFNFFLYIVASHVLGAFWYLFSIEQETACWHKACGEHTGCTTNSFNCDDPRFQKQRDYSFLNDYCPVEKPDTAKFDFGIFLEAIQLSGTARSKDFPKKILNCFWWGLRNLSSSGQNLETSTNFWENFFAVFISIFGLLLFLYFIGNVQTYMQLRTQRSEEVIKKMKSKERDMELWISRNKLDDNIKQEIMPNIQRVLEQNIDFDAQNPLPHLPIDLRKEIKRHLCLPLLEKVPMLAKKSEKLLLSICDSLKPVFYNERTYIVREGEPLDAMLFITQGIVWNFTTSLGRDETVFSRPECVEKGRFYGEELLAWGFGGSPTPNLSDLPVSTKTVKTHTNVEAFALMANDLRTLLSRRQTESTSKSEAASALQAAWRRFHEKKNIEMSTRFARRPKTGYHVHASRQLQNLTGLHVVGERKFESI